MAIDKTLYPETKVDNVMTELNQAKSELDQLLALCEEKKALYAEAYSCIAQEEYERKLVDMLDDLIPELNKLYMGTDIAPSRLTNIFFHQYKNFKTGMDYMKKCDELRLYANDTVDLLRPIGRFSGAVKLLRGIETRVRDKQAQVEKLSAEFDQAVKEEYSIDL